MNYFHSIINKSMFSGIILARIESIIALFISSFFITNISNFYDIEINMSNHIYLPIFLFLIFLCSFFSKNVKNNIKTFLEILYAFTTISLVVIAFYNNFNKDSFFLFILIYVYLSVLYREIKIFFVINIFLILIFIIEYYFFSFELETSRTIIYTTYFIIFILGNLITQVRFIVNYKLADKKNFLDTLFNSSSQGLLLVNSNDLSIKELNVKAKEIFELKENVDYHNCLITDIEIQNEKIFFDFNHTKNKTLELKNKNVISFKSKKIFYSKKYFFLISVESYKSYFDLSNTPEFNKLKKLSDETYNNLFEENSSMLSIFDLDYNFIDLNKTLLDIIEYTKEEIIGKPIEFITHKEVENREQIKNDILLGKSVQYEKSIKSKSGRIISIEVILRKGMFFGQEVFISNSRNIEERKKLEFESSVNYERYKTVTEKSVIGFLVTDLKGKIIDSNESLLKKLEYSILEIRELNLFDIVYDKDNLIIKTIIDDLINNKIKVGEFENRLNTKSRNFISGLIKVILQRDKNGNPKLLFWQIVDISAEKIAQKELEISEISYKELFNNAHEMLYILNKKNEFIDINVKVIEKYGYSEQEIIGKTPVLFSAPDLNDLDLVIKKLNNAWNGEKFSILWWSKTKEGTIFPKRLNVRSGFYKNEKVLIASGVDVSESYNYEKKLKEQKRSYRDLFERNLAGIYRTSIEGKILECNKAFLEILGYKKNEANIINTNTLHKSKEYRDNLIKDLKDFKFLKGKKVKLRKKDGELITVLLNAAIIYDLEGKINFFEGNIIDISEQERIQNELIKREEEYKELINSSSFGIVITRRKKILFANQKAADILEYTNKELLVGKDNYDVLLKEEFQLYEDQIEELKMKNYVPFMNYSVRKMDGSLVDVECKPSIIVYEGKKSLLFSFIDISDKKKIKAASEKIKSTEKFNNILLNQLKEKEVLLKEVHHRVKNNMQVISSILNLQSSYIDDPKFTSIIKDSQSRINSMALIHEKLYNTSNFSSIRFDNYITDLSYSLVSSYNYEKVNIKLEFNLEEIELSLNNAIPLGLILNELISNSLKYAFNKQEVGIIRIELYLKREEITLLFSDNGVGIPAEIDFKNTKTLGLQLVDTLVKQIKGKIELKNEKGANFSIKFNRFE